MDSETMCELADEYLWALEGGSASSTPSTWTGMREAHVEAGGAETRALYLCEGATVGSRDQLIMELLKQMLGGGRSYLELVLYGMIYVWVHKLSVVQSRNLK